MSKELQEIKSNMLKMTHYSHASHIGAALSVVDILYYIYKYCINLNKENINNIDRDKVILSKGHASIALYSVLAELGLLDKNKLNKYYIDGGVLPGHLDKDSEAGVDCSAGSLGHGLPIAVGMALANSKHNVFIVMGDGETQEGSVWEAFIYAGKHPLSNLTIVIDSNNLQAFGNTDSVADYTKLCDTLNNFGLEAYEINGHNFDEMKQVFAKIHPKQKLLLHTQSKVMVFRLWKTS